MSQQKVVLLYSDGYQFLLVDTLLHHRWSSSSKLLLAQQVSIQWFFSSQQLAASHQETDHNHNYNQFALSKNYFISGISAGAFAFRQSGSKSRKVDTATGCYVQSPSVCRGECPTSQRLLGLRSPNCAMGVRIVSFFSPFFFVGSALQGRDIVIHPEMGKSLVSLHSRVMCWSPT